MRPSLTQTAGKQQTEERTGVGLLVWRLRLLVIMNPAAVVPLLPLLPQAQGDDKGHSVVVQATRQAERLCMLNLAASADKMPTLVPAPCTVFLPRETHDVPLQK